MRKVERRTAALFTLILFTFAAHGRAQDGPLSEYSKGGMREGSRPVGEGSATLGEASSGSMRSGPVRQRSGRSMRSGPVSEASAGSVRGSTGITRSTTIGESSAGAVKKNLDDPTGARISESLTDLEELQNQLRNIQPLEPATLEEPYPPLGQAPIAGDEAFDSGDEELPSQTEEGPEIAAGSEKEGEKGDEEGPADLEAESEEPTSQPLAPMILP